MEEYMKATYGMVDVINRVKEEFWRKHYFCLLKKIEKIELEYTYSLGKAVVFLKNELIALSKKNKLDYSLSMKEEMEIHP